MLEQRLPPGDTLLGILAGWSLFASELRDREFLSTSVSDAAGALISLPIVALNEFAIGDADAKLVVRQQRSQDSERLLKTEASDSLATPTNERAVIGRPQPHFSAGQPRAELTPMFTARGGAMQTMNPWSISSGLSAVVVAIPQSDVTLAAKAGAASGQSTGFYFEKNVGQAEAGLDFVARGGGYMLGLSATEAIMAMEPASASLAPSVGTMTPEEKARLGPNGRRIDDSQTKPAASPIVRMQLLGGNSHAKVAGVDPLITKINYFLGDDPNKWHTNVSTFGRVQYKDVYPGIDLVYYSNQQQLEYDFVVSPGVDPNHIQLNFTGADNVQIAADGSIVLQAGDAEIRQHAPYIYQEVNGTRQQVSGQFALSTRHSALGTFNVSFDLGNYDAARPLVIDPMVVNYSTYLGGPNYDYGYDVAVDTYGNAYVTGKAGSSFPLVNPGLPYGGGKDAFVSKFSRDGSTLLYSTYIGGGYFDSADSIAVLGQGHVFITGATESGDFPTTPGSFQPANGDGTCNGNPDCADAFITRLSPDGASLIYSTYLGTKAIETGEGIAADTDGNAYIFGMTNSANFPVVNGAQSEFGGGSCDHGASNAPCQDAFIAKLNPAGTTLIYATYLGGSGEEAYIFGETGDIAIDPVGYAYVTGYTNSFDFPTVNALQPALMGNLDAYVAKLTPDGSAFVYSTYLGGNPGEYGNGIAADAAGIAYVTGETWSDNFPTTPGSYKPSKTGGSNNRDAYVSKLKPDGSGFVYSTFLGGSITDGGTAITVDKTGSAYVAGFTKSTDFPTRSAFQQHLAWNLDGFVTKFTVGGDDLMYSSYLGGNKSGSGGLLDGNDSASGIALDLLQNAYVVGSSHSPTFPTVKPFQAENAGYYDAFLTKVSRFGRESPMLYEP
jgi:hypothetical protein